MDRSIFWYGLVHRPFSGAVWTVLGADCFNPVTVLACRGKNQKMQMGVLYGRTAQLHTKGPYSVTCIFWFFMLHAINSSPPEYPTNRTGKRGRRGYSSNPSQWTVTETLKFAYEGRLGAFSGRSRGERPD
ncbi:hypothetical protein P167DRAFT_546620 [Morchella conica CCBAS932]|uniref:Uncharacterized protein n=1 Tax=Morchella conica CCBAS932 TaxID=1392247 RepID=A0A3N4KNL6_9PEZI|nr:hypothetical protein P167DRAFT_546620 [Morchella conica CCBAS932]